MRKLATVVMTAALVAGTACGGSSKGGSGRLSVSTKLVAPAAPGAAVGTNVDLGSGIALSRVRLALRSIGLEGSVTPAASAAGSGAASHGADDPGGDRGGGDAAEDPGEVRVGPFLVDLSGAALAGGVLTQAFDADVPDGTYRELKIVVGPVDPAGASSALAALAGSSVIIDGEVDGVPFTFTSGLASVQKRESTVVVGAASSNVTLTVSPAAWFETANGSRLDPRDAASRPAIEANVAASIDAFGDADEDGHDDARQHGEGAGHG